MKKILLDTNAYVASRRGDRDAIASPVPHIPPFSLGAGGADPSPLTKTDPPSPMRSSGPGSGVDRGETGERSHAITADTDLHLCRFFGLSDSYWLRAQAAHDAEVAADALAEERKKITPWQAPSAHSPYD